VAIKLVSTDSEGIQHFCVNLVGNRHNLTHIGLYRINNEVFATAFMPYASCWYAYDIATGLEIATFRKKFFDQVIFASKIADIVSLPDNTGTEHYMAVLLPTQA